jgi:outer membrane receptor protein involved in Fe transport
MQEVTPEGSIEKVRTDEADDTAGDTGKSDGAVVDKKIPPEEITVTGSRIRGLLGEQSVQPVLTITSEDIERYGVTSLGEVFQYIPQVSNFELGQAIQHPELIGTPTLGVTSNRVTATLRSAILGGTLLLVDGRRVPKTGQAGGMLGNDAYDLGGIPLSAVERIDVLLDGASAVYGADAVGGVINVILKKHYRGTEARVGYENTFDTDVSVRTLSLTHGFASGRLSGLLSASWEDASSMMWADRPFLLSYDRRFLGGPDFRSANSGYDGPGVIMSLGGNLPGLGTGQAAIPAGSTGTNLTVDDYANAGPVPQIFDSGRYARYSSPYERRSMAGNFEFAFGQGLSAFVDARWSESETWSSSSPIGSFNTIIPPGAPGNPFDAPIRATKYFFDLPIPEQHALTSNHAITAGFRGDFLHEWHYEASAHQVETRPRSTLPGTRLNPGDPVIAEAFASPNPPILLYDSSTGTSQNPPGTIEALTENTSRFGGEDSEAQAFDVNVDGPVLTLPAGDVRVSFGAEYRDERVNFPLPESSLSVQSHDRYTSGYFAEMRLPLARQRQGRMLLSRLEAHLAVRHDQYSDFSSATSPRYGLLYGPFEWLMLRGSWGKGYKVPTLVQLYRPETPGFSFIMPGAVPDALRGNEPVASGPMSVVLTGNPELTPERSEHTTVGAVLELPFTQGFSLSFDYYETRYLDRVGSLALADRIVLFPETVMRGDNLPGDESEWPGPVVGYEDVAFNIAVYRLSGYDVGIKYQYSNGFGDWAIQATASKTLRNELQAAPGLPPTTASATYVDQPLQVRGSLFWTRGGFRTGVLYAFRDESWWTSPPDATEPVVPSAIRWDWQGSYDFAQRGWNGSSAGWWRRALADTRINLTIFNVFNVEPPLRSDYFLPDNSVVDSRLRRYSIGISRSF